MRWLSVVVVLAACGDDAQPVGDVPEVVAACAMMPLPSSSFAHGSDVSPAVGGTLAGWDPTGRWFLTGVRMGSPSSYDFANTGGKIVVDKDPSYPASLDDTELFQRYAYDYQGTSYIIIKRVSNQRTEPDGTTSFRAERAVCEDGSCTVCTAKMVRATHFENEGEGAGITYVGGLNDPSWGAGYTFNVRMVGTVAYLIRQDGLHVIETGDPAHPVELGLYRRAQEGYSNDVKLVQAGSRRYAIIADTPVDVVDVTDPAHPVLVANIPVGAHTAAVEQRDHKTYAYFGNYDGSCPIYDISDPTAPLLLGTYWSPGLLVHDLSVENGVAYLNAWSSGFIVVDFTNPASPQAVGTWAPTPTRTSHSNWTTTIGGRHIALHGEEEYGAHLSLVDVDPTSPTYMKPFAEWKTRDWISIHNLMAFGSKAYFSYYQDGIRILDLADPTSPKQIAYYNTWDPDADYTSSDFFEGAVGLDVDLARKLIFVADSPRGLLILHDDTP